MCDEQTVRETDQFMQRTFSRRQFNAGLSLAMLGSAVSACAHGDALEESEITISTPDGEADGYLVHPRRGRHAAVIMWPDIMSIRPAFRLMGKQLAQAGYTVLVVNPYYRTHRGDLIETGESVQDPEVRARLMPHRNSLSAATCVTDGLAYIDYLDQHPSVDPQKQIGIAGYCMTGAYGIRIGAAAPGRVGAAASFHGGGLVTEEPDSPHRLVENLQASLLVAIAENDHAREPDARDQLQAACDVANVPAEIEVYAETLHGWCPLDSRVYHEQQAQRAWNRMLHLFGSTLS